MDAWGREWSLRLQSDKDGGLQALLLAGRCFALPRKNDFQENSERAIHACFRYFKIICPYPVYVLWFQYNFINMRFLVTKIVPTWFLVEALMVSQKILSRESGAPAYDDS